MLHLQKYSILLNSCPIKNFQESNNFFKLFFAVFKTKKEPVAGLIPTFSQVFLKI